MAGERNPEALPQIADEPLHFALGLRPIWRAQPRLETTMPGKVEKARIEAVSTATMVVPLQSTVGTPMKSSALAFLTPI